MTRSSRPSANPKLRGLGLHHVALRARDFDRSVSFYRDVLGCETLMSWGEGDGRAAMLDFGDGHCVEVFAGGKEGAKPEGELLHFALRCDEIDEAYRLVREAGMEITSELDSVTVRDPRGPVPVRLFFFKGPDGEIVELIEVGELTPEG